MDVLFKNFQCVCHTLRGDDVMVSRDIAYIARHPVRAGTELLSHPFETWTLLQDRYAARRELATPPDLYSVDSDWEQRLHSLLGIPWPCRTTAEFWALWPKVIGEMQQKGIRVGPESFKGWNDGDAGLIRAIWCLTRHLRPENVVETGVAHGLTSRFILEALEMNGGGHLWSIDRPPLEHTLHKEIGLAVGDQFRHRWTYIKGSSRQHLPRLLDRLGEIDLFIHDSLHSERNVRFEVGRAWASTQGAIVVDDIDANRAFKYFKDTFSHRQFMICEAETVRPDLRRFNGKGLFGIILKKSGLQPEH